MPTIHYLLPATSYLLLLLPLPQHPRRHVIQQQEYPGGRGGFDQLVLPGGFGTKEMKIKEGAQSVKKGYAETFDE